MCDPVCTDTVIYMNLKQHEYQVQMCLSTMSMSYYNIISSQWYVQIIKINKMNETEEMNKCSKKEQLYNIIAQTN